MRFPAEFPPAVPLLDLTSSATTLGRSAAPPIVEPLLWLGNILDSVQEIPMATAKVHQEGG